MNSQESMQPVLLMSGPASADAKFLIDLAALLMEMDPRTSDPSAVHHSVAKQSLDAIIEHVFRAHPEVLGLMETMKTDKKKEQMRYRLTGCAQLMIAVTSPPRDGAAPSVLVVVYKAICRGLFEILAVVFGVDTGGILNLMRSRRAGKSEKVQALTKHFHVEDGHGAKEIKLLFSRLVNYEKGKTENIVDWVITVMYVDQMAPLFDSKYHGIIRADKYYKLRAQGRPFMSNKDASSINILLQHTNVHFRNTPVGNFNPAWILYKLNISPAIAIAVTTTVLDCACENDTTMDFQGDLSRKVKWEYGLRKFKEVSKDPGFLMTLLHEEVETNEEEEKDKPLSIREIQEQQALQSRIDDVIASPVVVDVSGLLEPSPFTGLTAKDQGIVMESPCRDVFRKIVAGDRVRIDIPHQRMLIACILGDFEEKDADSVSDWGTVGGEYTLADRLQNAIHHTTHSDSSDVVCPRGTMCLIHGFIHDGVRRVQETCYDPQHTHLISNTLREWKYLARYFSIIGGSTSEKRQVQKQTRNKKKTPPLPPLIVPAGFIPPKLWMKCGDKIDQNLEFNDNDFNSAGKDPMGQENSQLLQLWYLQQRVGTKMLNRWKSRVSNKTDFIEFRDIVFDNDKFESLRRDLHCTENTFRQFGVYLAWFHELLKVGPDRKVSVGFQSVDADPLSVAFAKEMKTYLGIVEWAVARRTLLPTFTYLDEKTNTYVCHGRNITRVEIHQLQECIDLSRSMCEYTSEEDRVLTHGRNITYERYAYRRLPIKEEQEAAEIESKKQKDNQPTAISKPSLPPMRNEERKSNPFGPESLVGALDGGSIDPDTVVTTANSEVEVRIHMMHLAQKSRSENHQAERLYNSIVLSNEYMIGQDVTAWLQKLVQGGLDPLVRIVEDYVGPIDMPDGPTRALTAVNQLVSLLAAHVMRTRDVMEATHSNVFLENQNPLINPSRPAPPVQMELKAPELIPQQHAIEHSLFLGHVFPAPGFLLTNGPDFIIREMSDFKVSGIKMLLLLVTGKPIKTGGIRIAWAGPNIQIDTTGSGMATYQIAGHVVRGFAAIHYPDLTAVCEHDSQGWCYMKNGGNLCIRTHKHQDGGDLSF